MQRGTLCNEDMLREGYQPKVLLYALDKLFYIFDQVKQQQGTDERLIVAYKILCLSTLRCIEWWHGSEKKGMPDALSLLNINDICHLEHLTWAVYDGALLVGRRPELPRNRQWCTVLVGPYRHIYWGHDDMAHCPLYTLASGLSGEDRGTSSRGKTGLCTEWPQESIQAQEKIQEQL